MSRRTEFNKSTSPCPVCGSHSKGCSATADGLHFCRGTPASDDWATVKDHGNGFISYRNDAQADAAGDSRPGRRRRTTTRIEIDWDEKVREYAALFPPVAAALAAELHLPVESLTLLPGVGYSGAVNGRPVFCFPERNAAGKVTGITERFPLTAEQRAAGESNKKMRLGGTHGLSIPAGWRDRPGPLLLPEGASNTLALTAAGLAAVGRPSNKAGVDILVELLRDLPADREVIVVGDNDRKQPTPKHPEGEWPGREGAEQTAGRLSAALGRPVRWTMPPPPAKDVRVWLIDPDRETTPWADRGVELLALLVAAAEGAAPVAPPDEHDDPGQWTRDVDESHRLAECYIASLSPPGQPLRLRYWREEFHEWRDGCYHTMRTEDIKARLTGWIHAEHVRVHHLELRAWESKSADVRGPRPKNRNTTIPLVSNVLAALKQLCLVSGTVESPAWLDGVRGPDPRNLLVLRNGLYDLDSGSVHSPTPSYFGFSAAGFDYIPDAPPPSEWLRFLGTIWGDDPDSIACLQEWFGYLLTTDTRQQKLLFLLGPTRAGKGTIATVLKHLVGSRNITNPTLSSFAGTYGLWPLVGKSVAIVSDARISGRTDSAQVVERLLSVSGEDNVDVERKYLPPIASTKLNTRFVILSNELPNLADASSAFVGRMILLKLSKSFYGAEDTRLAERLLADLPGILLWAVEGVRRLRARGRFTQPQSGADAIGELRDIASPVSAFVRDKCVLGARHNVEVKELYDAWKKWCDENGRREHGTTQIFGRNLGAAFNGIKTARPRKNGIPTRVYEGIRLKGLFEDDDSLIRDDPRISDNVAIAREENHGVDENRVDREEIRGSSRINTNGVHREHVKSVPNLPSENDLGRSEEAVQATGGQTVHRGSGESDAAKVSKVSHSTSRIDPNNWLYVSRKLELKQLPASQLVPAIPVGSEVYYRIDPAAVVWFEYAIADRDADAARQFTQDELQGVIVAQDAMYRFIRDRFPDGELDAARAAAKARGGPVPLPDVVEDVTAAA